MPLRNLFRATGLGALFVLATACSAAPRDGAPAHHTADGFRNVPTVEQPGFADFLRWRWNRAGKDIATATAYDFPREENDGARLRANGDTVSVTWIGHATVLLQLHGYNILTDPHFSERASPVEWAGPVRAVPPGVALADLPPIDAVLLSHNHYDSLDTATVRRLLARPGGEATRFYVPLGLAEWFRDTGVENVVEMDWWQAARLGPLTITATPSQHWSKRTPFDTNESLWAGWAVTTADYRFFFAGDTGYNEQTFRAIGERLGPFDLAALPIGAYEPRWFMKAHHVTPEEALRLHADVGARRSVAIHWGTFVLTDEPLDEPPRRLEVARRAAGLPPEAFRVLRHGETWWPTDDGTPRTTSEPAATPEQP